MAQARMRNENQTSREAGPEGEAAVALGLRALGLALDFATSGLPADPEFWAEREARQAARSVEDRRRARLDRNRVRALRDGEEVRLTQTDLKALAAADAVEAKAVKGKRGAPSIRAQASRIRESVGRTAKARADARRADLRLAQTVELDADREGEPADDVLESRRGQTNRRLRTRDGLKLLHERGGMSGRDGERLVADWRLAVGLRYRDRYELAASSLPSCLAVKDRAPPSLSLYSQWKAAQRRAALANQVRVLEVAVAAKLGAVALDVLRKVAGEARTIRSLTPSSKRRARLSRLLVQALDLVGDILGKGA